MTNKPVKTSSLKQITGAKGQTKSKQFFQADVSSKKRSNELYYETSGRLVIEDTKKDISKLTDL